MSWSGYEFYIRFFIKPVGSILCHQQIMKVCSFRFICRNARSSETVPLSGDITALLLTCANFKEISFIRGDNEKRIASQAIISPKEPVNLRKRLFPRHNRGSKGGVFGGFSAESLALIKQTRPVFIIVLRTTTTTSGRPSPWRSSQTYLSSADPRTAKMSSRSKINGRKVKSRALLFAMPNLHYVARVGHVKNRMRALLWYLHTYSGFWVVQHAHLMREKRETFVVPERNYFITEAAPSLLPGTVKNDRTATCKKTVWKLFSYFRCDHINHRSYTEQSRPEFLCYFLKLFLVSTQCLTLL